MKYISKYLFSFLLLVSINLAAQEKDTTRVVYPQRYGLRVGTDLHRLAKSFYDSNYKGLEFTADLRFSKKFYLAGELGNETKTMTESQLHFTTKGTYFKVGFDFNAYENWLDMENMIYAGMRLGIGTFSQRLISYNVYQYSNYYGTPPFVANQEFSGLSASWVEVIGGIKTELFSNLFLGFSVRLNYLISQKEPQNFANLYIPGFNHTYSGKFGAGFNYTLSYFMPIYKKK